MSYKEVIARYAEVPGGIIEAFHAVEKQFSYLPEEPLLKRPGFSRCPPLKHLAWHHFIPCFLPQQGAKM